MMRRLIAMLALVASATAGRAQGLPDHLQCYKITDTNLRRLRGIVDLDAPAIGVAPGCRLGKATLYCAAATSTVRPGTLLDCATPVSELLWRTAVQDPTSDGGNYVAQPERKAS